MTALTLAALNRASPARFVQALEGIYEHSPWVAERAAPKRPFATLAHLKHALVTSVREADAEMQLALIRAHPELAGKAMVARTLTEESSGEQSRAGLTDCTPAEFETLQKLNAAYNTKFGWPFILAVRGPRGAGLTRQQIIAAFQRRLAHHPDFERA
ncbi:MAG TPA: 2-oxo-4-hydroxy-4-carboxy-5-ureidoimidazoline decarboxylase, partial [Burkholderiaceae bacterium]|nr:2-oxo-4-hydroxy-4-carboxy-5-ureidoimidazoline decarboxylase [Burkholderiaceae bacterium]